MNDTTAGTLHGKVALVTGASSGIGEATAWALAREGASLALSARRADRLEALATELRRAGSEVFVHVGDLATRDGAQRAVDATVGALGGLDVLINNAGVMFLGPIEETDPKDWERMIDINLLGLMVACRAAIAPMRSRGGGHIVNVSSVSGRFAGPTQGGYNATKWGVNGFSEALRREVNGDGIKVTLIEPGVVATELTDHIPHAATKERYETNIAKMEMLQSEDIADAIRYVVTRPRRVSINEVLIRPLEQG
jgi:NADP-dependent 3-hydroxy acid dehydrogenase YdfG